jgi:hypothetical protein
MNKIYTISKDEIDEIRDCVSQITSTAKSINKRMDFDSDKKTINYLVECLLRSNFTIERIIDSSK